MSTTFPRTRRRRRGYDVEQVEDFLEEARREYGAEPGQPTVITAEAIRHMAFTMQKGGYSTTHVDAALERLEDAFATRERERALQEKGDAWYADARSKAQEIVERLSRPDGERFSGAGPLGTGYDRRDVDAFALRLREHFQNGRPLSVDEVRTVAFRPKRGGYREAQVDLLLDAVIDVMLALS